MSDPINLNKARKAKAAADDKAKAAENRVRHGRTKAERALDAALTDKEQRELDAKRRLRHGPPGDE